MRIVIQNQDTCPTVQGKAGKHLNRTVIIWASYTKLKIEYVVSNDIVEVIALLCGMQAAFQAEVDSGPQGPWVLLQPQLEDVVVVSFSVTSPHPDGVVVTFIGAVVEALVSTHGGIAGTVGGGVVVILLLSHGIHGVATFCAGKVVVRLVVSQGDIGTVVLSFTVAGVVLLLSPQGIGGGSFVRLRCPEHCGCH